MSTLTLADLQQTFPPYVDEEIEGVGTFRFHRLPLLKVLEYQAKAPEADGDSGEESQDAQIKLLICMIAESLGGDFNSDEGRAFLATLPMDVQTRLFKAVNKSAGLASAVRVEAIEEAKNE
jgi:hypothetical protein